MESMCKDQTGGELNTSAMKSSLVSSSIGIWVKINSWLYTRKYVHEETNSDKAANFDNNIYEFKLFDFNLTFENSSLLRHRARGIRSASGSSLIIAFLCREFMGQVYHWTWYSLLWKWSEIFLNLHKYLKRYARCYSLLLNDQDCLGAITHKLISNHHDEDDWILGNLFKPWTQSSHDRISTEPNF